MLSSFWEKKPKKNLTLKNSQKGVDVLPQKMLNIVMRRDRQKVKNIGRFALRCLFCFLI